MQQIEIAHGPNATGHDDQAQAAHRIPEIEVATPNTPPSPQSSAPPRDPGQEI
jgi:hypothetical protein